MAFSDTHEYRISCTVSEMAIHDRPHTNEPGASRENIELHVRANDYFPMMSTLLGFLEESVGLCGPADALTDAQIRAITAARKDLAYLHQHYRIVPND